MEPELSTDRNHSLAFKTAEIKETLAKIKQQLDDEPELSPALRSTIEMLILIVTLLAGRLGLNSGNSSKPPSTDPHRKRKEKKPGQKKAGGQVGHAGSTLKKVAEPDVVVDIEIDRRRLPRGRTYQITGFESRQVIDIEMNVVVTEYRAEVVEDEMGCRYVAVFPSHVSRPVQYGVNVKANSVYMSQFQMVPVDRVVDHFQDQMGLAISAGSICNFNREAYDTLETFEGIAKQQIRDSGVVHADETGINVDGKLVWLHSASTDDWSYFFPHAKRGTEAMNAMGILPTFNGILCHDHWRPYYTYSCLHALCNAHHLRELERAAEQDGQRWAKRMKKLLDAMNIATKQAGGPLTSARALRYRQIYRRLLRQAEKECPETQKNEKSRRGRTKQSKARNLLERLRDYETDVLRFLDTPGVPFTNNQAERDIRMTKVQQKISGCFRSMEGAYIFCRIRSYLSSCRKHGVSPSDALSLLFQGKLPDFCYPRQGALPS